MGSDHMTQHYDNARTGWNPHETGLSVAGVRHGFGLRFTQPVDGQVYAQPLFVSGVVIPGKGTRDVVYVATQGDSVYAFDANANVPALWRRRLVPAGEAPLLFTDIGGCPNIQPQIGITGTPAINRATNSLYVVAKTKSTDGKHVHQRLHALDLTTGADKHGSPVEIGASVRGAGDGHDGTGHIQFDPKWHLNRPGLLLSNGSVYVAFGSHCDANIYHGWVLRYDAATLRQLGVFNTSPDHGHGGAIWQSGAGLAADDAGHVYAVTGNGPFDADTGGRDYGDSVVQLRPDLTVADFFTPANQGDLNARDKDLGSGGAMVLPPQAGPHPHLLVTCGKEGAIYLIDRQSMGQYKKGPGGSDRVVQRLPHAVGGIWGAPAYYKGPAGEFVYYCGDGDHLKAFKLTNGTLSPASHSADIFPRGPDYDGGAIPAVSSNGGGAGTGVVWAIRRSNPLTLFAYDANDLNVKLFEGDAGPWTNRHGGPFMTPTPIHGKVYVGTADRLAVFGLK